MTIEDLVCVIALAGCMISFPFLDRDLLCARSLRVDLNEEGLVRLYFPKSALRGLFVLFALNWLVLILNKGSVTESLRLLNIAVITSFYQVFVVTSFCYKRAKRMGRGAGSDEAK
jgi:hypothetical protein